MVPEGARPSGLPGGGFPGTAHVQLKRPWGLPLIPQEPVGPEHCCLLPGAKRASPPPTPGWEVGQGLSQMGSRSPEGPCLNQLPHKISRLGHEVASGPSPAAPMATDGFPPGCEASYTVPSAVLGNAKTPGAGLSVRVSIYITWGFSVQPPPPTSCSQDITVPRSQPPKECDSQ